MDPAPLLGVSQSPEPAPDAFSPPGQTKPGGMLPVSPSRGGCPARRCFTSPGTSQPAKPLSAGSQAGGFGRRKPLPCPRAGVIPGERLPWSPVSRRTAFVPSSCTVLLFLSSRKATRFSPLAGNFNSATLISSLRSRDQGRNWRSGQCVQPLLGCPLPSGGPRRTVLGHSLEISSLDPSPHRPQFPQRFEAPRLEVPQQKGWSEVPWVQVKDFARRWGAANAVPPALSCCRESSPAAEAAFPLPVFHFELLEVLNKK